MFALPQHGIRRLSGLSLALLLAGCAEEDPPGDVVVPNPEGSEASYTLYSGRYTEEAHLLDLDGEVVHSWTYPQDETWCYAELMAEGRLAVIIKEEEGQVPGEFFELDRDSNLERRIVIPAHHDFVRLDDGNTILLCREYLLNETVYPEECQSDYIAQVTPDDEVRWEWHADEHAQELAALVPMDLPSSERDWAHTNTVERLPDTPLGQADSRFREGNLLFAMYYPDLIGIIDVDTLEVVWAWGPGEIDGPHMPTMLDNGHILIYDNGPSRGYSRVVELDPATGELVWIYQADPPEDFYSSSRGSAQRLPGGNTFIAESNEGRLFEVTPDGEIVWEWLTADVRENGDVMPIYRAMRYTEEFVESWL